MYFSLELVAMASMCGISYLIYNKYSGKDATQEEDECGADKNDDVNKKGFDDIDQADDQGADEEPGESGQEPGQEPGEEAGDEQPGTGSKDADVEN